MKTPFQFRIKRSAILVAILVAWQHGGQVHAADTNPPASREMPRTMESLDDRQKLGPGDRVTYRVVEDKDEPRSLTVTDSGDLEVPYYGLVPAEGRTSRQLAREIKTLLERELYHKATVIIAVEVANKERTSGMVYVTGKVLNAGGYEIPAGERFTVSKAILKAGGFSDFSDKKHVRLIRETDDETEVFEVNVLDIWEKGKLDKDMVVEAGDLIVVPARLINF